MMQLVPSELARGAPMRREQDSSRSRCRVGNNRVVDDVDVQSVDHRDSGAIPSGNVVRDDVVGDRGRPPLGRSCREGEHVRTVDVLEAQAAAAAGFRSVAHDQVGIDDQVGTNAVARGTEQSWITGNPMSMAPPHVGSTSGVPMTSRPPPLAGMVGLRLWLNRMELCSMSPL